MSPNEALALAIMAGMEAKTKKNDTRKSNDHPAVNIAMMAYWDGVGNMASNLVDVFDGKATPKAALDSIREYAKELRDVLQGVSE